jgi:hypothetical protein
VRKTRLGADGPVEFLFNYTRHPVSIDVGDDTFLRVTDGHPCRGTVTLRPYDSLVKGVALATAAPFSPTPVPTHHELAPSSVLPR